MASGNLHHDDEGETVVVAVAGDANSVTSGIAPAIDGLITARLPGKTWMAGSSPAMTECLLFEADPARANDLAPLARLLDVVGRKLLGRTSDNDRALLQQG